MQKLFRVTVDISKKIPAPAFEVNTNDLKSVKLEITITNGQSLLDLTDVTPRINIRKPDNEVIFQDCEIVDAKAGKVQIILENQAYLVPGTHTAEIACYKGNEITAITGTFSYKSVKGIMNDKAVESKSEFTAIDRKIDEARKLIEDAADKGVGVDEQARQEIQEVTEQLESKFQSTPETETIKLGPELLTPSGWTSAGWTGDFASGFTHVVGSTAPLSYPVRVEGGKLYKVELTLTNVSQGPNGASYNDFTLSIGGTPPFEVYEGTFAVHTFMYGLTVVNNSPLVITPRAEWDGKITNISVKEITGDIPSVLTVKDSTGVASFETRPTKAKQNNVFIGKDSGARTFGGRGGNVGVGANVLRRNTTGFWNTVVGLDGMFKNEIGTRNVAIGYTSLYENIDGDRNVAIGTFALHRNTHGRNNIAFGADALWNNTSGNNNIAISNCALDHNTEGSGNIALGYYAGYANTKGGGNVLIGNQAGNAGVSANGVVGIGDQALLRNQAHNSVAIGRRSMIYNTTGVDNVAIGNNPLPNNSAGSNNVAIGSYTCGAIGSGDISRNIAIGTNAGAKLSDGASKNIMIGASAGSSSTTTGSNVILIGDSTNAPTETTSNFINVGNLIYGDTSGWKMGVKVVNPTAFLHVRQGNTETPPLKFDNATGLTTTPQPGSIEYSQGKWYMTGGDGVRKQVAFV